MSYLSVFLGDVIETGDLEIFYYRFILSVRDGEGRGTGHMTPVEVLLWRVCHCHLEYLLIEAGFGYIRGRSF